MPEGLLCQEWMPPWLCTFIIISVVVLPQILNLLGAGKIKPIKAVAEKIKPKPKVVTALGEDVTDRLDTIGIRTNTTYRDLKSLSDRLTRTQEDIEQIKRDIRKILDFIED